MNRMLLPRRNEKDTNNVGSHHRSQRTAKRIYIYPCTWVFQCPSVFWSFGLFYQFSLCCLKLSNGLYIYTHRYVWKQKKFSRKTGQSGFQAQWHIWWGRIFHNKKNRKRKLVFQWPEVSFSPLQTGRKSFNDENRNI